MNEALKKALQADRDREQQLTKKFGNDSLWKARLNQPHVTAEEAALQRARIKKEWEEMGVDNSVKNGMIGLLVKQKTKNI